MPDGKLETKDVDVMVEHVLAEKNGIVTVTIQDGVILEIKHESTKRRVKQPNK
jgi:hypothetical protein